MHIKESRSLRDKETKKDKESKSQRDKKWLGKPCKGATYQPGSLGPG